MSIAISPDTLLPIVYRCDQKYSFFLINSILSVLKYYKGKKNLHFYICTNDNLNLNYLDSYKAKYNFDYTLLKIDSLFFRQHKELSDKNHLAIKRYFSFNYDDVVSDQYNDTTYQFNPFRRNKFIVASSLFFLAVTNHKKVVSLDTDTLVVTDIDELYNIDISNVICSTCPDWGDNSTKFNPSVSVINTDNYKEVFFANNGILMQLNDLNDAKLSNTMPYCEAVQRILNNTFKDNVKFLDKKWNVPITHIHEYPEPKIYHFSESWTGNKTVLTAYNSILDKSLKDEQYKYSES